MTDVCCHAIVIA